MLFIFQKYFYMALEASAVILVILAIRPLFKKFSNRIACLLWAVVMLRLLCPFTIQRPSFSFGTNEKNVQKSESTVVKQAENGLASALDGSDMHADGALGENYENDRAGSVSGSDRDIKQYENRDNNIFQNAGSGSGLTDENGRRAGSLSGADIEEDSETAAKGLMTGKAEDEAETSMMEKDQKISMTKQLEQNQKVSMTEQLEQDQTLSTAEQSKSKTWTTIASVMEGMKRAGAALSQVSQRFFQSRIGDLTALICGVIWFAGMILFGILGVLKYYSTVCKLRASEPFKIRKKYPVRLSDASGVPLSFGIMHPTIYLPTSFRNDKDIAKTQKEDRTAARKYGQFRLSQEQKEMILWHEEMHLRHHDPLWKVISFLALCAHWWNPLVWLAIRCMNQDLEMACDEAVLEQIGQDKKTDYATTLLEFATSRGGISLAAAFGESHAERRIVNVIKYRKAPVWLSVVLSVSVLLLGGCLATTDAHKREQEEISEQTAVTEESVGEEIADDSTAEDKLVANEGAAIAIDETHFPDPAFRGYVNQTYDTDQDGVLSEDEILAVTEMKCGNMGIGSLKGVEIFSNLERLDCRKNDLTDLDISKNTKLRCLACSETGINTLDITNCPRLICVRAVGSWRSASTYDSFGEFLDEEKDLSISLCESLLQVNEDAKIVPECEPEKGWDISCMFTDIREERWKEIYLELIENCLCDNDMTETVPYAVEKYAFLYLNDDSVPELVAIGACEDDGTQIFSIANGKVISMRTARREFFYKERGNILDNCAGDMGYYYDYIWKIGENGFERVHNCENEVHGWEDVMNPTKQEFWIDDQPVSEKEYYELIDGLIPAKERVDLNDYEYYGKCSNLKEYLKGEVLKDYKKAYTEIILQNGFEGLGYALIERDGAAPLLLSVNEYSYQFASFDDGLISDYTAPFEGERITYGYEDDIVYVYPKLGLLERYYLGERGNGELSSVWIGRYEMRMGTLLDSYLHTNDAEVLASVALPAKVNNADDPFVYSINSVNVSKDEYMDCISNTKGKEKLRVAPYGSEDAEITYLSKEEMLKKLAE